MNYPVLGLENFFSIQTEVESLAAFFSYLHELSRVAINTRKRISRFEKTYFKVANVDVEVKLFFILAEWRRRTNWNLHMVRQSFLA